MTSILKYLFLLKFILFLYWNFTTINCIWCCIKFQNVSIQSRSSKIFIEIIYSIHNTISWFEIINLIMILTSYYLPTQKDFLSSSIKTDLTRKVLKGVSLFWNRLKKLLLSKVIGFPKKELTNKKNVLIIFPFPESWTSILFKYVQGIGFAKQFSKAS